MGRAASSLIKRPWMNWNVENRAQRMIEKQEKPKTAPLHPSSKEQIDNFRHEHPEILEEQHKKDLDLAKMLDGLVVSPEKFGEITSKKRTLPEDRSQVPDMEFGYLEPDVIRPGRCSIRQALQFLGSHYSDPENYDAAVIAKQYNLSKDQVNRVLQYFGVFLIQIPGRPGTSQMDTMLEIEARKPNANKKLSSSRQDSNTDQLSHQQ